MLRTSRWKMLAALALTASPAVVLGQGAAPQTHTVRKGDTLWDLARQYRGDPFLWPDLYRMNTSVVEDPHWIYPGEVLQLAASDTTHAVPTTDTPAPTASADSTSQDSTAPVVDVAVSERAPADSQRSLAQLTAASEAEEARDLSTPLFGPRRNQQLQETLRARTEQPYHALRRSEFYASGFLTENQPLPFGKVLGPVTPQQIRAVSANANAFIYTTIALEAPRHASYQIGDTLMLVQITGELRPYGDVVVPTGLAQVTDTVDGRYTAMVVAAYGPIRSGQRVLPVEQFTPGPVGRPVAVSDGVRARFLGGSSRQDLKAPQMVVFLDKGRADGVAPGDIFEAHRRPERLADGTQRIDELMATMQVVRVRDHTATARLLNVLSPDLPPGTEVRQVAKLPS